MSNISGCQFQIFNGPVKLIQQGKKRRDVVESDDEDSYPTQVSLTSLQVLPTCSKFNHKLGLCLPQLLNF